MTLSISIPEKLQISYTIYGQGHPVVFLPGGGADAQYYKPFLEELGKSYNIYAIDYPGFSGTKPLHEKNRTFESYANVVNSFIQELQVSPFIISHSLGGGVARKLIELYPTLTTKAVLMAPFIERITISEIEVIAKIYNNQTKGRQRTPAEYDPMLPMALRMSHNYAEMLKQLQLIKQPVSFDLSSTQQVQKLFILGENDTLLAPENQKAFAQKTPNSRVISFADCGHDLMFNKKKEVVQDITEFFSNTV